MSTPIFDGGPAFPQNTVHDGQGTLVEVAAYGISQGMTMRDYFAAKALPALIELCREHSLTNGTFPNHCAIYAYEMADAMLAARGRK